ncbi:hypothetical protein vseg_012072 [Gypsophila vaccaria]
MVSIAATDPTQSHDTIMTSHALVLPATNDTSAVMFVNLSQCTKLTTTNYSQWAFQIQFFLEGLELFQFLDGSHDCPEKTITVDDKPTPNPAYTVWSRQDRLLLAAVVGTLDGSIAPLVTQSKSAREAWATLSSTFANPSRGHILQLKNRLETITKRPDQTITDYMRQIKTCTLELTNLGKLMDPEDIIAKVIRGFNPTHYRAVKEMVEGRETPISFDALHEKLLNHDLVNPESTSGTSLPTTAFAAHYRNTHTKYPPRNVPSSSRPDIDTHNMAQHSQTTPVVCQYCNYKGHTFPVCRNFKKAHPFFTLNPYMRPNRSFNNRPHAHTATASTPPATSWLVDSGATHHLTNDLSNLASHTPYDGLDDVLIGDGSALPISNIGYLDEPGPSPRHT